MPRPRAHRKWRWWEPADGFLNLPKDVLSVIKADIRPDLEAVDGAAAMDDKRGYRRGVGIMLLDARGKVFVGARIYNTDEAWQMPQGGIDPGEDDSWLAGLRELEEETGIKPQLVERIEDQPQRMTYDLPEELRDKLWGGRFKGQDQDWYIARFLGSDGDINIRTKDPEFREWKWVDPPQLVELIVPFKRELYRHLLAKFEANL